MERAAREGLADRAQGAADVAALVEKLVARKLIDDAGLKGHRVGKAFISDRHANFFTCEPGARTDDLRELVRVAQRAVQDRTGLALESEVVFWSRHGDGT